MCVKIIAIKPASQQWNHAKSSMLLLAGLTLYTLANDNDNAASSLFILFLINSIYVNYLNNSN
jgi:hypothetical protein